MTDIEKIKHCLKNSGMIDALLNKAIRILDKHEEYEDLEEQGLLIKLPCKVDEKTKEQILFLCSNDGNLK
jgi:hypothetical protein